MSNSFSEAIRSRAGDDDKTVVGVPGTPFPNEKKEELLVTFKFDAGAGRVVFSDDFERAIQRKISGRPEFAGATVTYHPSGTSSAVPFAEQGVTVEVPGEALPLSNSDVSRFEGVITREGDNIEIQETFYDMRGLP